MLKTGLMKPCGKLTVLIGRLASEEAAGVLFGVPISIKEAFDVGGMKTTGGLLGRKDFVMDRDAEVVRKLRAEGAIILGKSNTPELCFARKLKQALWTYK
ncbi:hypothetical protein BB776_05710 [Planococcus salinarum]|uniref:Amidase domain-containing protein n=1 Tax=Planococcus salinarum TaxID=622695 RepID=A0ABX3D2Q9_9BACL|nr:hypothetical protein BB776_05710 [Planococcus salinarum]